MNSTEQQFFDDLEKKLWTAANKLLSKNASSARLLKRFPQSFELKP